MRWGLGRNVIPRGALSDRVDVYQRVRTSANRRLLDVEERIEEGARALIVSGTNIAIAALLGPSSLQSGGVSILMDRKPEILAGYVLQVSGTQVRYQVRSSTPFPSKGAVAYQVLDCVLDANLEHP